MASRLSLRAKILAARSSVPGSGSELDEQQQRLHPNNLEYVIYQLFKINVTNVIKIKASLSKEFHLSPLDLDQMPMWEYEMYMEELQNLVQEENDRNQEQMDKAGVGNVQKMTNPRNLQKMTNPKMPQMPTIKMPSSIKM